MPPSCAILFLLSLSLALSLFLSRARVTVSDRWISHTHDDGVYYHRNLPLETNLETRLGMRGDTVRFRGMGTGISEPSKRVPILSFATQGGKQVSSHFRQGNWDKTSRLRPGRLEQSLSLG